MVCIAYQWFVWTTSIQFLPRTPLNDNNNVKYFDQFSSSACSTTFPHSGGEESTYAVYVIMNTTLVSNEFGALIHQYHCQCLQLKDSSMIQLSARRLTMVLRTEQSQERYAYNHLHINVLMHGVHGNFYIQEFCTCRHGTNTHSMLGVTSCNY